MKIYDRSRMSVPLPSWVSSLLAVGVLLLCVFLLTHYLTQKTPQLAGHVSGLLSAVWKLLVLLFFLGCSGALGLRLFRLLAPNPDPVRSDLGPIYAFGLGFTFYSLLGLLISMAHVLSPAVLWLTLLLPIPFCRREWVDMVSLVRSRMAEPVRIHPLGVLLAVLFLMYGVTALSPPWAIDELTYHVTIPKEYLKHGGIPATTTTIFNYQPVAMSMLYLYLMGIGSDDLPKLLHYFFLLLMTLMFYWRVASLTARRLALLATLLFASQWVVQHGVPRANVDFHYAFYCLASFFLLLDLFLHDRPGALPLATDSRIVLSGIFLGTAIYSKYTAISAVAGSELLLLYLLLLKRIRVRHVVMFNLLAVAVFVPCMIRNVYYTGDPLFWFLSKALKSYHIFNAAQFEAMPGIVNLGVPKPSVTLFLLGPLFTYFYGAYPTINFDGFIDPLYLVTMVLGLFWLRTHVLMRVLYIYIFAYYGIWILTAPTTRYLLPILPLLALISTMTLHGLADTASSRFQPWIRNSATAILLLLGLVNMTSFWVSSGYFVSRNVQAFLGLVSRQDYLKQTEAGATLAAVRFIEEKEKKEGDVRGEGKGKIFMVHANQSYYLLDRGVFSDVVHVNLPLLKSLEDGGRDPVQWLRAEGYRYVLYDVGRIAWYARPTVRSPYLNPHPENIEALKSWVGYFDSHISPRLENLGRFGGLMLYEVADPPSGSR